MHPRVFNYAPMTLTLTLTLILDLDLDILKMYQPSEIKFLEVKALKVRSQTGQSDTQTDAPKNITTSLSHKGICYF